MRFPSRRPILPLLPLLALVSAGATGQSGTDLEPVRLSAEIGGHRAVAEVRDLPSAQATAAARAALEQLATVGRELASGEPNGTVTRLNSSAGRGPQPVDGDIGRMLQAVASFCAWSHGALGPLGGLLYETWETATQPPAPNTLERGARSAGCENLTLDPEALTASLAAGSRLDLRHFTTGYAVDRAVHGLIESGVTNAWVEFRSVTRALGPGPEGRGWEVTLPLLPGMTEALDPVYLRDQALAVISTHRNRFRFGDMSFPPFLDERNGRPASGTVGAMVVTRLALDAQAIGSALVVLGNREGQLRLGGVVPSPSVLWLLGDGSGAPLIATFRWSEVTLP